MMDYLKEFKRELKNNPIEYFQNIATAVINIDCHDDLPNLICYSSCHFINNLICNLYLAKTNQVPLEVIETLQEHSMEVSANNTKYPVSYHANKCYFQIVVSNNRNNDKHVFYEFIKTIASTKCIKQGTKHVFKIIIAEKLSSSILLILKHTISKYQNTAHFIILCPSLGYLTQTINSMCLFINCRCNVNKLLETVLSKSKPSLKDAIVDIVDICLNDVVNVAMYLEYKESTKEFPLNNISTEKFHSCLLQLIQKQKECKQETNSSNVSTAAMFQDIHALSLSMMNTIMTVEQLCRLVINVTTEHYIQQIHNVVELCSYVQYTNRYINKTCFTYDYLLLNFIKILLRDKD